MPTLLTRLHHTAVEMTFSPWGLKVIGISGATAVAAGAYGTHSTVGAMRDTVQSANRLHLVHTVALMISPLTPHPKVFFTLVTTGIVFFCGSCYHTAFTQKKDFAKLAPIGGLAFIAAWLTLLA